MTGRSARANQRTAEILEREAAADTAVRRSTEAIREDIQLEKTIGRLAGEMAALCGQSYADGIMRAFADLARHDVADRLAQMVNTARTVDSSGNRVG